MSVTKPYILTVRPFKDGSYTGGAKDRYIHHVDYAQRPSNYIRSYLLLQKDLIELFNYIEPSDTNLQTYSFRIQELLVRTCIELEANFRAILELNEYSRAKQGKKLSIKDYYKINSSHYLSNYSVKLPYWSENLITAIRTPFKQWGSPDNPESPWTLSWYQAYNATKHDKANSLQLASFENLLDAFCGLVALITSQYLFEDFSPKPGALIINSGWNDGFDASIGDYFRVALPRRIPVDERYDFDWQTLAQESSPIQKFNYDTTK